MESHLRPAAAGSAAADEDHGPGDQPTDRAHGEHHDLSLWWDGVPDPVVHRAPLPGNVDVEINYAALSFINAAQTHYEYKLEGLDDNWTNAGERRIAYYSHLPPGKYVFHVIAANGERDYFGRRRQ